MSRQVSIDTYFKSKSGLTPPCMKIMDENINVAKKRRSLSLTKTLGILKSPKYATPAKSAVNKEAEVICLSSDDENTPSLTESLNISQHSIKSDGAESNSSQATIPYSLTPQTPVKTPRKTPLKTPQTSNNIFQSPGSKKFYSPTKKRNVVKQTQVKKNLARESFIQPHVYSDDLFREACEGMDDKTIFLLSTVNKYLKDYTLAHLLPETSQELLGRCFKIVKPGMRLVCRLYWRQPGWYRREQLLPISGDKKEAIDDPTFQEMMHSLIMNSFITTSAVAGINSLSFEEYAKILKADEIKQICKDLKLKIQSKQDAIEALSAFRRTPSISQYFTGGAPTNNARRVIDIMKTKVGTCYKLSDTARNSLYKLYLLMYLGMNYSTIRDKQLELVLINDKVSRETYPVDKGMALDSASVVFRSKDEFAKYVQAHMLYENYLAETDPSQKCKLVANVYKLYKEISEEDMMRYKTLPEWLRRFTPPYLYVKLLESGVQECKKQKSPVHYQLALDILSKLIDQIAFRQHNKAEWYAEKALILHKLLFRHDEAAETLLEGLKSTIPEDTKDVMRPRASKLAKQQNIELERTLRDMLLQHATEGLILENQFSADHVSKQPMENYKQRGKKKFEIHTQTDKQFLDCEEYCIIHYTTNGPFTHGGHWEGRMISTIFYLLFWDIIYTKPVGVSGVFLSHYQLRPLDMFTESFYANRKTVIEDRLKRIESMAVDTLVETMRAKWEERPECELSGIHRHIGWDAVRAVACCLGAPAAAALCRRLAADYARAHAGFPDLTLWNAATKKIKFVEVKTDSDKPSMKQLQWMRYLSERGLDAGFCYVGARTTRCRARAEPAFRARPGEGAARAAKRVRAGHEGTVKHIARRKLKSKPAVHASTTPCAVKSEPAVHTSTNESTTRSINSEPAVQMSAEKSTVRRKVKCEPASLTSIKDSIIFESSPP